MIARTANANEHICDGLCGTMTLLCNQRTDHARAKAVAPVRERPSLLGTKFLSFLHCGEPSPVGAGNVWRLYALGFECSLSN